MPGLSRRAQHGGRRGLLSRLVGRQEIFLQLVRGETTINAAAETAGVDRSTIMKLRQVAKEGALAALSASRPGVGKTARDVELEAANAEVVRAGGGA